MLRRRRGESPGPGSETESRLPSRPADEAAEKKPLPSEVPSLLKAKTAKDILARFCFVGIFITENVLHAIHFELEVDNMVAPAVAPLPRELAVALHLVHIVFGL